MRVSVSSVQGTPYRVINGESLFFRSRWLGTRNGLTARAPRREPTTRADAMEKAERKVKDERRWRAWRDDLPSQVNWP